MEEPVMRAKRTGPVLSAESGEAMLTISRAASPAARWPAAEGLRKATDRPSQPVAWAPVRYRRVVMKLSGAALSGPEPVGLDAAALENVAAEILAVSARGVQVAIVVGGGNFFRGSL